jgi:uncharacterized membrane protein YwaF
MFLCRPPEGETIISLLGPWPWYILGIEGVGLVVVFILYIPFLIKDIIDKLQNKEIKSTTV